MIASLKTRVCLVVAVLSYGLCHFAQADVLSAAVPSSPIIIEETNDANHGRKLGGSVASSLEDGPVEEQTKKIEVDNESKPHRHLQEEMLESEQSEVVASDANEGESASSPSVTQEQGGDPATATKTTPSNYRAAWVAHGTIATIAWGLFVPFAIGSAWFRDLIPTYWIYIHVFVNVSTFALTFFAVGIAFATMKSMGDAGEGHLKERHHVVGLALLLLVSFQTANGFLRPPREYVSDDDDTNTEMGDSSIANGRKSVTARTLWYLCHSINGLVLFSLGTWQVMSGLNIFSIRFDTANWSNVYLGYILWLAVVFVGVKFWMKWKERQVKLQAWRHGDVHDPESDLAPVQYE